MRERERERERVRIKSNAGWHIECILLAVCLCKHVVQVASPLTKV